MKDYLVITLTVGFVVVTWCLAVWWVFCNYTDLVISGQFGDSFGGVTSLFSALAFAGIIATLIVQYKEFVLQREINTRSQQAHEEIAHLQSLNLKAFALTEIVKIESKKTSGGPVSDAEESFVSKLKETIDEIDSP